MRIEFSNPFQDTLDLSYWLLALGLRAPPPPSLLPPPLPAGEVSRLQSQLLEQQMAVPVSEGWPEPRLGGHGTEPDCHIREDKGWWWPLLPLQLGCPVYLTS